MTAQSRRQIGPGDRLELESAPGKRTLANLGVPTSLTRGGAAFDEPSRDHREAMRTEPLEHDGGNGYRTIRVLLADDHRIVREGLATMLMEEDDIQVVGQAADGQEAIELAVKTRPDVVLMDVTMPRVNGIEATRQITREMPRVRVIGLSMHDKKDLAQAMHDAGAAAYLTKTGCCEILIDTIRSQAT